MSYLFQLCFTLIEYLINFCYQCCIVKIRLNVNEFEMFLKYEQLECRGFWPTKWLQSSNKKGRVWKSRKTILRFVNFQFFFLQFHCKHVWKINQMLLQQFLLDWKIKKYLKVCLWLGLVFVFFKKKNSFFTFWIKHIYFQFIFQLKRIYSSWWIIIIWWVFFIGIWKRNNEKKHKWRNEKNHLNWIIKHIYKIISFFFLKKKSLIQFFL